MADESRKRLAGGRGSPASDEESDENPREPGSDIAKRSRILDGSPQDPPKPKDFIACDSRFVKAMLSNVKVLMVGDSLMRGLYKDFVTWLQKEDLSMDHELKMKAEHSYLGDRQIDVTQLDSDKVFRQAREYQTDHHYLQFFFSTRVMKDDMESLIQQMISVDGFPDVILINSMIWDLTRYFRVKNDEAYNSDAYQKRIEIECLQKYLDRTSMLLRRLRAVLPPHTMVLWVCFPHCRPAESGAGGMQKMPLTAERNHVIRSVMIDGSFRIAQVVRSAGYDVLDIDFFMRNHAFYHYQKDDGMHWWPAGMRLMSQLTIQFLAKSWGIDTSGYLSRLESEQNNKLMSEAEQQMISHSYYSEEVQKLHDNITTRTLKAIGVEKKYHLEQTIEMGRALAVIAQAPARVERGVLTAEERLNMVVGGSVDEEIRLAPLLETPEVFQADEVATTLAVVARMVR